MDTIDANKYTLVQLKEWLNSLGLPTSGTKGTLASRINAVPVEERGVCPALEQNAGEDTEDDEEEETTDREMELIKKELELIKRERDLLAKENDLLKKTADLERTRNSTAAELSNLSVLQQSRVDTVSFGVLREFLPEFDGSSNLDIWAVQLKSVGDAYGVDDNMLRALLISKLRGKALAWLQSTASYATETTDSLLAQMEQLFGKKEGKLLLRRNFEGRKWQYGESFTEYYNEKIILANQIKLDEDELIDCLIDGIPDIQLRTQAIMQNFSDKSQLQIAFAKIELKRGTKPPVKPASTTNLRCYNCNSLGHYAADCKKAKREPGTCYGCGSSQHLVASCPKRRDAEIHLLDGEDYVRYFKIFIDSHSEILFLSLECLIDSGSPISFVRESLLPKELKLNKNFLYCFCGINKSELKVLGTIFCSIIINEKKVCFELCVVPDESMGVQAVLGRDFMKACKYRLVCGMENENGQSECNRDSVADTKFDSSIMAIEYFDDRTEFAIGDSVTYANREKFCRMFDNCYLKPERPIEPVVRSEMRLILEDLKPFNCPPRRLSYSEKIELQRLLDEYLSKGYIRASESEFASPIVLVRKKTGELRMCVDYRRLNKVTARDNYPIPLIDDLLDRLAGKTIFSKLDLKDGFFHVYMDNDAVKYTSFITPLGQYEFLRMPFGLKNAPSVFQRFVNKVFADMVRNDKVIIYLDDIMIATDNFDEHFRILEEVFKRLVENRLELRLDKCVFLQSEVKYLGYTISGVGIRADDKGLRAIENFPVPSKAHSVQSFLGLCSYFRRFIKDFSILAKPLYELTRRTKKFEFGPEHLECFELLKRKLVEAPILALYDPRDVTELHCDASSVGLGAILMQKKRDGKMHPIFYFSRRTTESESKYHSFELETLAIVSALKRFRVYLQGTPFKIVTDCNSLTLTLNKKELNPRIARWALELQNYDYTLEHRPGTRMQHVDALSRSNILVLETNTFEENLIICQGKDKKLSGLRDSLQKSEDKFFEMRNGVVYRKKGENILFCVPSDMESHVMFKYHDEMGHVGVDKMTDLMGKTYWFPGMREKAKAHIRNCLRCIAFSANVGREEGFLHNIPKADLPFDTIHIDHFGPVDNSRSKKYLLVIIDASTKFVRLYPTRTTSTREVISSLRDFFRSYSRPRCLVSDRGSSFTSGDFKAFLEENNIQHVRVATASPQANGQVERVNRSLKPMIAKLSDSEKGLHWDNVVETVEFCINNTIHRSINEYPSRMLFGVVQKGRVLDTLRENLIDFEQGNGQKADLGKIRRDACRAQGKLQAYNKNYVDLRRKTPTKYERDDYVMVRNFDSQTGPSRKLMPKFKGPYRISKVLRNDRYVLEDVEGFQRSRTPYSGVWAVGNLRPWFNSRKGF